MSPFSHFLLNDTREGGSVMRKTFAIMIMLMLVSAPALSQQEQESVVPLGNWAKVASLAPGTEITLRFRTGETADGRFRSLEADSIRLQSGKQDLQWPKSSVREVVVLHRASRANRAALAGGITFGVGFGIGYAISPTVGDDDNMPTGERLKAGAAIGGLLGGIVAGICAATRPGIREEEVIYQAI
jgi:hypothetical protein